jgi:hypothetical protein
MRGARYQLCAAVTGGWRCTRAAGHELTGAVQTLGTWTIRADERLRGVFRLTLRVAGKTRAQDTVAVRARG